MAINRQHAFVAVCMSVGSGGPCPPPWIFIHSTDKVEGDLLMVLFLV